MIDRSTLETWTASLRRSSRSLPVHCLKKRKQDGDAPNPRWRRLKCWTIRLQNGRRHNDFFYAVWSGLFHVVLTSSKSLNKVQVKAKYFQVGSFMKTDNGLVCIYESSVERYGRGFFVMVPTCVCVCVCVCVHSVRSACSLSRVPSEERSVEEQEYLISSY